MRFTAVYALWEEEEEWLRNTPYTLKPYYYLQDQLPYSNQ